MRYIALLCVLCCFALFVCLTLFASFFLPSHLSFKNMYTHPQVYVTTVNYTVKWQGLTLQYLLQACCVEVEVRDELNDAQLGAGHVRRLRGQYAVHRGHPAPGHTVAKHIMYIIYCIYTMYTYVHV